MSRERLIKKISFGQCVVTIHRKPEFDEFVVRTKIGDRVVGGKSNGGYFTDDKHDARGTAAAMIKKLRRERPNICRKG